MVPHRRPYGRRALLPYELDLCTQLGVTPDEYWEFLVDAQEYVAERSKEYGVVPNISNGPISGTTAIVINLVVGLALTAVSALLAPKPKAQSTKRRENLEIAGRQGRTRYTKSTSFDSIQQLAQLGDTIPLVFADQQKIGENTFGGVRMDTDMLFSQMVSNGNNQLLYALLSLGMATLAEKPDYDGIAIGDLLLRDFSPYKNRMFYGASKRLTADDAYTRSKLWEDSEGMLARYEDESDAFAIRVPFVSGDRWKPDLSGARTPTTAVQFGCFSPLPNGHRFYLPYELVMVLKGDGGRDKVSRDASRMKRRKLSLGYPRMAGITDMDRSKGLVTYTIYNRSDKVYMQTSPAAEEFQENNDSVPDWDPRFEPYGLADAQSYQDETRIATDEVLQENQQFLLGSTLAMLIKRDTPDIWTKEPRNNRQYTFRIEENFDGADGRRIPIPMGQQITQANDLSAIDETMGGAHPWQRGTVQQVAIGSITNNRQCHVTEIGLKSEVWRRMTGSFNFNACPPQNTINDYEEERANITVGTVTTYMRRYSFFRLFARPLGEAKWANITDPRVQAFGVLGASPMAKYNTISIRHPEQGIYEYRFVPVPGSEFYTNNTAQIVLLDSRTLNDTDRHIYTVDTGGDKVFEIAVTGTMTGIDPNNSEWYPNSTEVPEDQTASAGIVALSKYTTGGDIPEVTKLENEEGTTRYEPGKYYVQKPYESKANKDRIFVWDGVVQQGTKIDRWTIEVVGEKGNKIFRYREADEIIPEKDPEWKATEDDNFGDPRYDLGADKTNPSGYNACVYYDGNGKWQYVWGGKIKATHYGSAGDGGTDDWVEGNQGKKRYRRSGEEIREEFTPLENEQDKYEVFDGVLLIGAQKRIDSDILDFYISGTKYGSGTNSRPKRWEINSNDRWVADRRQQSEAELTPNRLPNTPDNGVITVVPGEKIGNGGVTNGVVVKNLGEPNVVYSFYWQGVRIAQEVPNAIIVYGGHRYRLVGGQDGQNVGVDKDIPCFPINVTRLEEWSITHEVKQNVPLTYAIARESYIEGQDRISSIKRTRYNVRPAEPNPKNGKVVSIRHIINTEDGEKEINSSAKALAFYYPALSDGSGVGRIDWQLLPDQKGDDYRVGDQVRIGRSSDIPSNPDGINAPKAEVTQVEPIEIDTNEVQGYFDFIDKDRCYFPLNAICDYYINDTDTSSHANNPEHSIVFCNEIIDVQPKLNLPEYENLSLLGLKITNSKEWSSFNSISAYIAKGLEVERLEKRNGSRGPTNLFPNIAYALLTDPVLGAGDAIGAASVDRNAMKLAAEYCSANLLFWDGVIDQAVNLREFIYENAAYVLCDFTVKGGKFSLIPSLPLKASKQIDYEGKPQVKALFTDGVVRNTQVSFLTPEERQPFQAVCLYRSEVKNGFSEVRSMLTRFNKKFDASTELAPIEEFDMTRFCTSEAHARLFSRVALMLRAKVDHSIKFETTPQAAMTMEPGDYFRFASKITHTERFASGVIDDKGYVNSSEPTNGTYDIVYWKPGTVGLSNARLTVGTDGKTSQTALWGVLWSKVETQQSTRIYKCESLSYSDDGLVEVAGSYAPLTPRGTLQILEWGTETFEEEIS